MRDVERRRAHRRPPRPHPKQRAPVTQEWGDPDARWWHRWVVLLACGVTLAALYVLADTFWWTSWR